MIKADQPTCFPEDLIVAVSSRDDETLLDRSIGVHNEAIVENRRRFLATLGVDYDDVVYQRIVYDDAGTYELVATVDNRSTQAYTQEIVADGLITRSKNVALFLPVADCVATVVYDQKLKILALLHLGRHSTFANLLSYAIDTMKVYGTNPTDLIVWMPPSAQKASYGLEYFDYADDLKWQGFYEQREGKYYIDMQGYNKQCFIEHGVQSNNIFVSPIDTGVDKNYFSHSHGDTKGRIAVVAMMK